MSFKKTRDRLKWQACHAIADLMRAENHLGQIAGIASDRSDYINESLPEIMAALRVVLDALRKFNEGL